LKIASIGVTGQGATIRFHSFFGQHYSVEYSTNLAPGSWTALLNGAVQGDGQDAQVTDPNAVGAGGRFYRVKELP